MKEVDAEKYLGRWYQMLRRRNPEDFGDCSYAEYWKMIDPNQDKNNEVSDNIYNL